jgi:cytochrome P450
MDLNVTLLMLAGSETTATLLTGFTYYLATHPSVYSKLMQEIRSAFTTQKDITMTSVEKLEYLNACIREALRVYPPVPTGFARVAPPGGGMVSGYFVPEGVRLLLLLQSFYSLGMAGC